MFSKFSEASLGRSPDWLGQMGEPGFFNRLKKTTDLVEGLGKTKVSEHMAQNFKELVGAFPKDQRLEALNKSLGHLNNIGSSGFPKAPDSVFGDLVEPGQFSILQKTASAVKATTDAAMKSSGMGQMTRHFKEWAGVMPKNEQWEALNKGMQALNNIGAAGFPRSTQSTFMLGHLAQAGNADWLLRNAPSKQFEKMMKSPFGTGLGKDNIAKVQSSLSASMPKDARMETLKQGLDSLNPGNTPLKLAEADGALKKLGATFMRTFRAVRSDASAFSQSLSGNFSGITSQVIRLSIAMIALRAAWSSASNAIKNAAGYETTMIQFEGLIGSVTKTKQILDDLVTFSIPAPFHFSEYFAASRSLLAFGLQAKDLMGTIKLLSDVSAGSGKSIDELANIFGKILQMGHLMGREAHQLVWAGIPIYGHLAKVMGKHEMQLISLQERGEISFGHVLQALIHMTEKSGPFFNISMRQSETLAGRWSTMTDTIEIAARRMGEALIKKLNLKEVIRDLGFFVTGVQIAFGEAMSTARNKTIDWAASLAKVAAAFTLVVVAMKLCFTAAKGVALAIALIKALSGPRGWADLAIGVLAFAAAWKAVGMAFDSVAEEYERVKGVGREAVMKDLARLKFDPVDSSEAIKKTALGHAETFTDELRKKLETFGMSELDIEFFKLKSSKGVKDDMLKDAYALKHRLETLEAISGAAQPGHMFAEYSSRIFLLARAMRDGSISMKDFKHAKDALDRAFEKDARTKAIDLLRDNMTPFETFQQQLDFLDKMLMTGRLAWDVYADSVYKAYEAIEKVASVKATTAGPAIGFGTQEAQAFMARFESMGAASNNPTDAINAAAKQSTDFHNKALRKLDEIRAAAARAPVPIGAFR